MPVEGLDGDAFLASLDQRAEEMYGELEANVLIDCLPNGFFKDYLIWCQTSESPTAFHLGCAISLLSSAIGRGCGFPLHGETIYAPVSTFLVSPAGSARRGGAIKPATSLAQEAEIPMLMDCTTSEGLTQYLATQPQTLIIAEEASTLLSGKEYMSDVPSFLCRVLDSDDRIERNLRSGKVIVNDAAVAAVFGSAPSWFHNMPKTAVGGGVMSRFIVVYEHEQEKVLPFPADLRDAAETAAMRARLVTRLREVRGWGGRLEYRPDAKALYEAWYRDNHKRKREAQERLGPWFSRKPAHTHRINMAQLAAQGRSPVCDADTLDSTITLLNIIEEKMHYAYSHMGLTPFEARRQKTLLSLSRLGGQGTHSRLWQLVSHLYKDREEFGKEMETIESIGDVVILRDIKSCRAGRPATVYKLARIV